jgi:osmotically-inducible protein OsmY
MFPKREPLAIILLAGLMAGCEVLLPNPYTVSFQAATVAAATAAEERTLNEVGDDLAVKANILHEFVDEDQGLLLFVSADVYQGDVMLTGAVKSRTDEQLAETLARRVKGVKRIFNDIQITEDGGLHETAKDMTIEVKVKAALAAAIGVRIVNYRWRAINEVVYLIGTAQSEEELDTVYDRIRGLDEVFRVVTHVRIKPGN